MIRFARILLPTYFPVKRIVRHTCFPPTFLNLLRNLPKMELSKLQNGLSVVTEERECSNACIGFFFDAGSRYESPTENGIAHFFEHIAFKGTTSRAKTVLEDQMSRTGARFKCFTTREMIGYYVECHFEDIACVYNILADCLFNNNYSQSEIELQKNTVYLEMQEHDKNTRALLDDYLHLAAFQGTPLGQTVLGPTCNLYTFNQESICNYQAKTLDPTKIVLVGVGGIKHEQLLQLACETLEKLSGPRRFQSCPCRYTGSEIRFRDDSIPVAHVALAVEGPGYWSVDNIFMDLAATIVGGWDKSQTSGLDLSSRVARSASTSRLCESYKAFNIAYKDTGLWGVQFISPKMVVDDMVSVVQDEWMKLCTIITDGEIERAKNELITKLLTDNESTAKTCRNIGRWILYKKYKTHIYDTFLAIEAIKVSNIREACYKYIYDKCPVVVAVGATECLPEYTRVRAGTYWLRY